MEGSHGGSHGGCHQKGYKKILGVEGCRKTRDGAHEHDTLDAQVEDARSFGENLAYGGEHQTGARPYRNG